LVPFFTPRGGIFGPPSWETHSDCDVPGRSEDKRRFRRQPAVERQSGRKGVPMYIGVGTVVALILIVLLIMLLT
jgi:hypothetical protein